MRRYKRLGYEQRVKIETYQELGYNKSRIAKELGLHRSSIGRELTRNRDSQGKYRASYAHKKHISSANSRRYMKRILMQRPLLQQVVHTYLKLGWSPKQIQHRLLLDYPDTPSMHIAHETIYQYIYVLPRGELKKTLIEGLRRKHKYRRTKKQEAQATELRGKIQDMLSIHERPAEVADRTVPGHWESDLIIGKYKRSAIATLVERTTRYTIIVPLPHGKGALEVREALTEAVSKIPLHLRKTLTHDQGKEMSQHKQFSAASQMQVYFADPASPWQRGSNENTNGLIRQYFPKGTDFSLISPSQIQYVQDLLNGRPRQSLDFLTPHEIFSSYVALDD